MTENTPKLSDLQTRVAKLTAQGLKRDQIAERLGKNHGSIDKARREVVRKTGLHSSEFFKLFGVKP